MIPGLLRKSAIPSVSFTLAGLLGATVAMAQKAPAGPVCTSSAWTGTVSYQRTHHISSSKTEKRVSGRGEDTTDFEMDYRYKAVIAVTESPDGDGSNTAMANVVHTMTSRESTIAKESNSCDRGKSWQEMTGTFSNDQVTKGEGKEVANVTIGVSDDGTYSIGVSAPRIKGVMSGAQKASYSGQCTKKEGKQTTFPETPTQIEGGSLRTKGTHRIDPANPNKLSGSYTQSFQGATETITWNLQKCGADLRVTDLKFEDMRFPNWDMWRDVDQTTGTTDGNFVRMKATVFNASAERRSGEVSFKETYKGDKWDGAKPDLPLKDQTVHVTLEPGEAKDVEILWDSSGYAWFDDGRPRLVQRVKAELWEKNKLADSITRNLKVAPKPVVLVHGSWAGSLKQFEIWQNLFTTTHSYDWKAFPVGEKTESGRLDYSPAAFAPGASPVAQTAASLKSYIDYAQKDRNAWHVDVVAHSGGGVVARYYISQMMPDAYPDFRPQISHLLMLGTPNTGTPCANQFVTAAETAGRDPGFLRQLTEDSMAAFNTANSNRKGVKFSALAGKSLLPIACYSMGATDGVVPVTSAHWVIADRAETDDVHAELPSTKNFSEFVKPRLAIGPRGDHEPATPGR